jgi:hypothetical protein
MKILISGCARSGTTLMTHLMRYFYNTEVKIDDEHHPYKFMEFNYDPHLVIKKPAHQISDPDYFSLNIMLEFGWKVIWMIRDGRDVISSLNGHVSHDRWIDTNMQLLENTDHPNLIIVQYESLVNNPEVEMEYLSLELGIDYDSNFLDFHTQVDPESPFNKGSVDNTPITKDRIGNWNSYLVDEAINNSNFIKLQKIFGYGV